MKMVGAKRSNISVAVDSHVYSRVTARPGNTQELREFLDARCKHLVARPNLFEIERRQELYSNYGLDANSAVRCDQLQKFSFGQFQPKDLFYGKFLSIG